MATATPTEPTTTATEGEGDASFRPWPISLEFYERMIAAHLFSDERVFLWKGRIVEKMSKGWPHTVAVHRLRDALDILRAGHGHIEQEAPVRLVAGRHSMPEPDLQIIRGRMEDYVKAPTSKDVLLVVEVAESSLAADRREKLGQYAFESIPAYWIANTVDRLIEVYSGPTGPAEAPGYASRTDYRPGGQVPVVLDGVEVGRVAVAAIFMETDPWLGHEPERPEPAGREPL